MLACRWRQRWRQKGRWRARVFKVSWRTSQIGMQQFCSLPDFAQHLYISDAVCSQHRLAAPAMPIHQRSQITMPNTVWTLIIV